jgi:hypothetical protein
MPAMPNPFDAKTTATLDQTLPAPLIKVNSDINNGARVTIYYCDAASTTLPDPVVSNQDVDDPKYPGWTPPDGPAVLRTKQVVIFTVLVPMTPKGQLQSFTRVLQDGNPVEGGNAVVDANNPGDFSTVTKTTQILFQ